MVSNPVASKKSLLILVPLHVYPTQKSSKVVVFHLCCLDPLTQESSLLPHLSNILSHVDMSFFFTVVFTKFCYYDFMGCFDFFSPPNHRISFCSVISLLFCNICKVNTKNMGVKIMFLSLLAPNKQCNPKMHCESQLQQDALQEQSVFYR